MKKISWIAMLAMLAFMMCCNSRTKDYVDLGLPSGTQWKIQNEEGFIPIGMQLQRLAPCIAITYRVETNGLNY